MEHLYSFFYYFHIKYVCALSVHHRHASLENYQKTKQRKVHILCNSD